MKRLLENWRRFVNEAEDPVAEIQKIIQGDQYLSHLADQVTPETVKAFDSVYYIQFPGELQSEHLQKHFDQSSAGSTFSVSEDKVQDLILKTVSTPPHRAVEERGTKKLKWLNVKTREDIGHDTLVKRDPNDPNISMATDLETFGMVDSMISGDRVKDWSVVSGVAEQNDYELVTKEGAPYTEKDLANNVPAFIKQELGVVPGDKMQNPTKILNVITAQVGEVDEKPVLTLMSVFPGHSPVDASKKDIMDKKQFKDHGYYFLRGETK